MSDYEIFEAGDVVLQNDITLRNAKLAYKTHGKLNVEGTNAVIYPTRYGGTHVDNEFLIGEGMALDPAKYFIVVPNKFGNGVSSSPSNTDPPFSGPKFPRVTIYDNVMVQHRLATEVLGVNRFALAVGWSMGAQQAYQWACLFPDMVERLAPLAGAARCAKHNFVFLEGVKAALTADVEFKNGWYEKPPLTGLRAMGRVWAGWALSQTWYRKEMYKSLGYSSLDDFLIAYWEGMFLQREPNDLLAMIDTWQQADISANDTFNGDFEKALGAIMAKTYVMPGQTDMYFPPEDGEYEAKHIAGAEFRPIPSLWGHYAGGGKDPTGADTRFIDESLKELLSA